MAQFRCDWQVESILNSWGDTMDDRQTLIMLRPLNQTVPCSPMSSARSMMPPRKIDKGDKRTLEIEVLSAWADGTVTFSLFGHPGPATILGDSPQIVSVEKGECPSKAPRRRTDA